MTRDSSHPDHERPPTRFKVLSSTQPMAWEAALGAHPGEKSTLSLSSAGSWSGGPLLKRCNLAIKEDEQCGQNFDRVSAPQIYSTTGCALT